VHHHYLPQFYLKRWCEPERKLWRYRREPSGRVSETRVAPRGTAFEPDLYAIRETAANPASDTIETEVLAPIDDAAARALEALLGQQPFSLDPKDQAAWVTFLVSLLHRHVDDVYERDRIAPIVAEQSLADCVSRQADEAGREQIREAIKQIDPVQLAKNAHRGLMVQRILDPAFTKPLAGLTWVLVPAWPGCSFITSDRPLAINFGEKGQPLDCFSIPLSPRVLLFGHSPGWGDSGQGRSEFLNILAGGHDIGLLRQRPRCVYSREKVDDPGLREAIKESLLGQPIRASEGS
jgi:hypothetical protein